MSLNLSPADSLQFLKKFSSPSFDYYFVAVVSQDYEAQVYDLFVIKGNSAIFKCNVPSYVSDHIDVVSWHDTKGNEYSLPGEQHNFGIYAKGNKTI